MPSTWRELSTSITSALCSALRASVHEAGFFVKRTCAFLPANSFVILRSSSLSLNFISFASKTSPTTLASTAFLYAALPFLNLRSLILLVSPQLQE